MKPMLLLAFMVMSTSFAFSQDSYVTTNGETIQGKIENYKEWSKNPTSVIFKDIANRTITITPENCKSFSSGLDQYVSYHGTRILNSENVIGTQELQSDQMVKDSINVFLRKIYQYQNYSLYKLFDSKRTNFYFSDGRDINELEFYETLNSSTAIPFYGYKYFLQQQFKNKNIPQLDFKVQHLNYKENDLINFFAGIFNDQAHATEKLRNKYPSEILIGLGANSNVAGLEDVYGRYTFDNTSFSPSLEVGLRIYSQRNFGELFFEPAVSVMSLSNSFNKDYFKVKTTMVNFSLGAGYAFVKKANFTFYAVGAGSLPVLLNFETRKGSSNKYVPTPGPDDRITVRPELGVAIKKSLNISVAGMLPIRLPFTADQTNAYKVSQATVALRYAFIQAGK